MATFNININPANGVIEIPVLNITSPAVTYILQLKYTGTITVDWGEGTIESITSTDDTVVRYFITPTFTSYNGTIRIIGNIDNIKYFYLINNNSGTSGGTFFIKFSELTKLTTVETIVISVPTHGSVGNLSEISNLPLKKLWLSNGNTFNPSGNINSLIPTIDDLKITGINTITGNINHFINIQNFVVFGNNTLSGDIKDLPTTIQSIRISGFNTISGDTIDLDTPNMYDLYLYGSNTITGNLINLPSSILTLDVRGNNTLYGNLDDLQSILYNAIIIEGNNTISGNINNLNSGLTLFAITGNNTISGDIINIPSTLISFRLYGNNTISGTLDDLTCNLVNFNVTGDNTITGDIINLTTVNQSLEIAGDNTVYGDLNNSNASFILIDGLNEIEDYTSPHTFKSSLSRFRIAQNGLIKLSSTEVDNILIDIDNSVTSGGNFIILTGHDPRTATSDTAVASLITKGFVVSTT